MPFAISEALIIPPSSDITEYVVNHWMFYAGLVSDWLGVNDAIIGYHSARHAHTPNRAADFSATH